jgi:hypothetical protein
VFAAFPGFEEFALRVEVEWQGRARPVVARLEQAPSPLKGAVVVCRLEDAPEEGEWLVLQGLSQPLRSIRRHNEIILRRTVRNAFSRRGLTVGQFLELDVPRAPGRVLLSPDLCAWLTDEQNHFARRDASGLFRWKPLLPTVQLQEQLQREWEQPHSDARFAWGWAQLSRDEKMARVCGFNGNWGELRRVMRLVLLCSGELWNRASSWNWSLHHEFGGRGWLVNFSDRRDTSQSARFAQWQTFLFERFAPDLQSELLKKHLCAREFWRGAGALESVRLDAPPTMHERLEARLELRAWLEGRAMPDEIERLLSPR